MNHFQATLVRPGATPGDLMAAFVARYAIERGGGADAPERFVREIMMHRWSQTPEGWPVDLGPMDDPVFPGQQAEPDPWQCQVLRWYGAGERRIGVKSGHGPGKTALLAWISSHHLLTKYPQKTAVTAPTTGQLFDAFYPELKDWISRLPTFLSHMLEIKSDNIELRAAPDASFLTAKTSRPETPEALAGIHSVHVLLIVDEGSGVPDPVYEAASGSMSSPNATVILAGNPVRTSGYFFDVFHKLKDYWKTLTISCLDSRRVTPQYVEEQKQKYGEKSNAYRVRVLGEFPITGLANVIGYESVATAIGRDIRVNPAAPTIWGLDVARFGDDLSALCKRKGNRVLERVETWGGLDLMQLSALIKGMWDRCPASDRPAEILIDSIGMGSGVVDRLRQLGLPAFGVNVSESAAMSDQYLNLRAELWFLAKDWLAKLDCSLPDDEELTRELCIPEYKFTRTGKLQVESKEEMKKRGFDSPNRADAFVLTHASTAAIMTHGGTSVGWGQPLKRQILGIV